MQFVVYCKDKRSSTLRSQIRADHLRHIIANTRYYRLGCPLIGEEGKPVGSVFVLDVADRAELEKVLAADPYFNRELFESVEIHATRQIVPEPAPGTLAAELEKELASRA